MGVFASTEGQATGHEQVVFCQDKPTGLRAIIGIYSTALGPALGGTRFYPYASEDEALHDVLELSRAMAYKNALAGLDLGGGKAVIWGDPDRDKTETLLRAYGRFVQALGGRYYTACDVGTYVRDMDVIARETRLHGGETLQPEILVEHRLRVGDAASEILQVTDEVEAGLIVMATHGRTGLGRALMGSVAESVLRGARCPVLTVKSPLSPTGS